ncbi:MAG: hypothetical protein J6Q40_02845 [Tidjanibacter sp.]|nr:hypothetical protein [Tidjanibacter sp.]
MTQQSTSNLPLWRIVVLTLLTALSCSVSYANENLFRQARELQLEGKLSEAVDSYISYLSQPANEEELTEEQVVLYTEALMQLMNSYQSKGEPETCVSTLQELFKISPILQDQCLRDYYSVLGYALSRTEKMAEAEEVTMKIFSLPLHHATPERFFRDYAYAAAVFYSNPNYQQEVVEWCEEALLQAQQCQNTSGEQWVTAMLGSLYKRNGNINKALNLFLQSKEKAKEQEDELGVLNSLHALIDLFLYWDVPEYANLYASEAIQIEKSMTTPNPMVSAQTYINKGRALLGLGEFDSIAFYIAKATELCEALPYNSGMVDVDLLHGIYLTDKGGDSSHLGIQELQHVVRQGTTLNQAKAYHQLAQTYLKNKRYNFAEIMLDSMYALLQQSDMPLYINVNYKPILDYYLQDQNMLKVEQYTQMMLQEQQVLKAKKLNFNLVQAITESQTEHQRQELEILQLKQANQRLWFIIGAGLFAIVLSVISISLIRQRRKNRAQIKQADAKLSELVQQLHQTKAEKEMISQEIDDIMSDKDTRQELEALTPSVFQKSGEPKFRQRFELLYPNFLPRLRERVPTITRREELLSMFIILKQDNKEIAELLAIAPRSVLMLRHRFRQKIGLSAESSLETFIEEILMLPNS